MTNRTHTIPRTPAMESRFWSKVDRSGGPDSCWYWRAGKNTTGYGLFSVSDAFGKITAHRLAYTLARGPIPDGLQLDHLCHSRDEMCTLAHLCPHRACVNPAHLEPVTPSEKVNRGRNAAFQLRRAKTHCPRGHAYAEHGFQVKDRPSPHRRCRICQRAAVRKSTAKAKARQKAAA